MIAQRNTHDAAVASPLTLNRFLPDGDEWIHKLPKCYTLINVMTVEQWII